MLCYRLMIFCDDFKTSIIWILDLEIQYRIKLERFIVYAQYIWTGFWNIFQAYKYNRQYVWCASEFINPVLLTSCKLLLWLFIFHPTQCTIKCLIKIFLKRIPLRIKWYRNFLISNFGNPIYRNTLPCQNVHNKYTRRH